MTVTEHKKLVSQIPEDLRDGEEIEVSDDGEDWHRIQFYGYASCGKVGRAWSRGHWEYARRHASSNQNKEKS